MLLSLLINISDENISETQSDYEDTNIFGATGNNLKLSFYASKTSNHNLIKKIPQTCTIRVKICNKAKPGNF